MKLTKQSILFSYSHALESTGTLVHKFYIPMIKFISDFNICVFREIYLLVQKDNKEGQTKSLPAQISESTNANQSCLQMKISLKMDRRGEMEVRMKMEGRRKANQKNNFHVLRTVSRIVLLQRNYKTIIHFQLN